MEISIKNLAIAVPAIILAAYAAGRYSAPTKVVTKIEVQTVTKTVEVTKDVVKTDLRKDKDVVIVETTKPDGTKVKETRYVTRTTISTVDTRDGTKNVLSQTDSKTETVTTNDKGNWNIAALAGVNTKDKLFEKQIGYGLVVQRRILGPVYLGGFANGFGSSSQSYGVTLGGSF